MSLQQTPLEESLNVSPVANAPLSAANLSTNAVNLLSMCSPQNVASYPFNVLFVNAPQQALLDAQSRLKSAKDQLYTDEGPEKANVDIWQLDRPGDDFKSHTVRSLAELKPVLGEGVNGEDPLCRCVFVYGFTGRSRLRISEGMLLYLLSRQQASPSIIDFLQPFGAREYARDYFFSGFRQESWLRDGVDTAMAIPELGRSGRRLELCYNLKSVEQSRDATSNKWSIRSTAVYYYLDIANGRTVWIIIKGKKGMQQRIQTALGPGANADFGSFESSFAAGLRAHYALCEWSAENWRWYLNDIENDVQIKTRKFKTMDLDASGILEITPELVREISFFEEKINAVIFILNSNLKILGQLRDYYKKLINSPYLSKAFRQQIREETSRFASQLSTLESEMKMQLGTSNILLRLISDRKTLAQDILGRYSADELKQVNQKLYSLANKTKLETITMRIITIVTLFFLPGTFVCTLFGTDIVKFQDQSQFGRPQAGSSFAPNALWWFLGTTLLLMGLTLLGAYIAVRHARRTDRRPKELEFGNMKSV